MKKWKTWVALGLIGAAAVAGAEASKGTLYIQVPSASLQNVAGPSGTSVASIPGGTAVDWLGADKTKGWHKVKFGDKTGVLFQAVLGRQKPTQNLTASASGSGNSVGAKELSDSGAASKALSEGAVKYGKETGHDDAARQLLTAEAVSEQTTHQNLVDHAKKASLPQPPVQK